MRALAAAVIALGIPTLQPDAARVLADMRQALGGEAALAAVQSFSASGFESRHIDGTVASTNIEWTAALPDSFVRVRRMPTPMGNDVSTDGFRGEALIYRRQSPLPYPASLIQDATPVERARHEAVVVRERKRAFSRFATALFGPSSIDPVDVSYQGQRSVAGRPCDLLLLRASDGNTATLAVDAATHLPVSLSWMAVPSVTVSTTAYVTTTESARGSPSSAAPPRLAVQAPPAGDPTAGLSPVEHQILYQEFKVVDGLNWPHRFTEKVGDKTSNTTRVGKYKLNPKIDPKLFDPGRR